MLAAFLPRLPSQVLQPGVGEQELEDALALTV